MQDNRTEETAFKKGPFIMLLLQFYESNKSLKITVILSWQKMLITVMNSFFIGNCESKSLKKEIKKSKY